MRFTRLRRGRMGVVVVLMLLTSLLTPLTALAAPAQHSGGNTEWVQVYTVQHGDTLSEIAGNFGVSEEALMDANSLHNPNMIYVGQQLIIPESYSEGTGGPQCDSYYTVQHGDTLSGIALYYGVDEDELAHVNAIYDPNDIYFGQSLCIPSNSGNSGGNEYHQQPQQYPQNDGPQQPDNGEVDDSHDASDHQSSDHQSSDHQDSQQCDPCGQPQNSDHAQNDGSQHPDNNQQSGPTNDGDHQSSQQCDPCGQPQNSDHSQNDGSQPPDNGQQDGPHNDSGDHQSDHQSSQQCDPCGQPQNDGQQGPDNTQQDGPHNDAPPNEGDHQEGQPCNCDDSNYHDDGHHGQQLQPTDFWKGDYYNDKYFGEFFQTRQDLDVNFNWFTGSPIEGMNKDRFSVRWEKVASFKGGPTRFHATADDGVRVYVDDQLIIDHWVIQPATEYTADLNLKPGPHKVVVEYYEEAEDAVIHVFWEPIDHHDHDEYN